MNNFTENLKSIFRGAKTESKIIWGNFFSSHHLSHTYKKPSKVGLKSPLVKKTRNHDEAELFQDRIAASARESVTPLKLHKAGDTGDWVVEKSNKPQYQGNELIALDPFCTETNLYHLVHRHDKKIAPKELHNANTAKYHLLTLTFSLSKGKRQFTCLKTRKEKCHVANVYLHYLQSCLKDYVGKYRSECCCVERIDEQIPC